MIRKGHFQKEPPPNHSRAATFWRASLPLPAMLSCPSIHPLLHTEDDADGSGSHAGDQGFKELSATPHLLPLSGFGRAKKVSFGGGGNGDCN